MNNKVQKDQNPTATSELPEQKQGPAHDPCTQHHQGWGAPGGHPSGPTHQSAPTLSPCKEPAPLRSKQGKLLLLLLLHHKSQ